MVHTTPAKGSGQIHPDAFRQGTDEMATREMDPDQFRSLLAQESARTRSLRTPTIPATNEVMKDLVARSAAHDTIAPDDDLAIPVEARKPAALVVDDVHPPHEPLDLPDLDPRRETRHADAITPLAKPRLPTAPASSNRLTALLVILVLAIGCAVAYYVLTGRVV
jgi:hypothetical protein